MEKQQQMTQAKKLPIQMSFTNKKNKPEFKLILTESIETKIQTYCALSPNREWSGVLFYTFEGDFEKGVTITANDIYLMDQGSSTHTEFDLNEPEITRYMVLEGLINNCMGLLHSHNNFNVFFSGEDANTLQQYGMEMNNFVSVVVNNAGDRIARLTRKIKFDGSVTTLIEGQSSFMLFNTDRKDVTPHKTERKESVSDTWVEYIDLTVIKQESSKDLDFIHRFGEVSSKCSSEIKRSVFTNNASTYIPNTPNFEWPKEKEVQGTLFDEEDVEFTAWLGPEIFDETKTLAWEKHNFAAWFAKLVKGTPFISSQSIVPTLLERDYGDAFHDIADFENWFEVWLDYMLGTYDLSWIKSEEWDGETYLLVKTYMEIKNMSIKQSEVMCNIIQTRLE